MVLRSMVLVETLCVNQLFSLKVMEEAGAVMMLDQMIRHSNSMIWQKAQEIVEKYFPSSDQDCCEIGAEEFMI